MSKTIVSPPGWGNARDGDTQAFTGTSASKAIGFSGWVRFKAVGGAAHIKINDQSSDSATTTDYPLTDGVPEDFYIATSGAYVHVEGVGSDTGTLYWVGV